MRQLRLEVVGVSEEELFEHNTLIEYEDSEKAYMFIGKANFCFEDEEDRLTRQGAVRQKCLETGVKGVFMQLKKDCRWGKEGEIVELNP